MREDEQAPANQLSLGIHSSPTSSTCRAYILKFKEVVSSHCSIFQARVIDRKRCLEQIGEATFPEDESLPLKLTRFPTILSKHHVRPNSDYQGNMNTQSKITGWVLLV